MLTIILPIHGREEFTPRFLDCVNWAYMIIPARDQVEGLAGYWDKMVNALTQVQTPYAMVADNDDFPLPKGLNACIDFLETNNDFIACSGRIQGIWLWPDKLTGPYHHLTQQYAPFDTPATYDQFSVSDRVLAGFRNSWSYYAVYRTERLLDIWVGVRALDLKDFMVHEKFCAMRALTLGKVKCFDFPSYIRQYETSTRDTNIIKDWTTRLRKGEWVQDYAKVMAVMKAHGVDGAALEDAWAQWYTNHLNYHFGLRGQLRRWAKRHFPRLAYAYQHQHEYIPIKNRIGEIFHEG